MNSLPQIIISGSIAIDRIMNFNGHYKDVIKPDKIHILSISLLLKELKNTEGGVAANIAYGLALLKEKPILLGSVGNDAKDYVKKLTSLGINTNSVFFSELNTASFNVITDLDDNQVGGFYPGAMSDNKTISFAKWKKQNAFFVVSPNDPKLMDRLVLECKKNKLRMFYDFGQQVSNLPASSLKKGVESAELIITNDYEISVLLDKIKLTISELKTKVPVLVTTLGEKGAIISGNKINEEIKIKPAKPKKIVDPTGAGDAFRSGFLYGYIRKLDLKTCGQLAATSAVYAIETYGTQEYAFIKKEFAKRYLANYHSQVPINNFNK